MLFATQQTSNQNKKQKPHLQFIAEREERLEVIVASIVQVLWKIVDERIAWIKNEKRVNH